MGKASIASAVALVCAAAAPAAFASTIGGLTPVTTASLVAGAPLPGVSFGGNDYKYDNFTAGAGSLVDAQITFTALVDTTVYNLSISGNGLVSDLKKYTVSLIMGGTTTDYVVATDATLAASGSDSYSYSFGDFDILAGDTFTLSWIGSSAMSADNSLDYSFTTAVPVPASAALMLAGLGGLVALRRKS